MGKKSRRPNRNTAKDIPAVASTAVTAPREETTTVAVLDPNQRELLWTTFNQLCASQDWEGLLELESEMSAIAKTFDSSNPRLAGCINLTLGDANKEMGREGGIEEASLYYKKGIELAKKAGNNENLSNAVLGLSECYVKTGRVDEAMDLHKSLCDEIGKESLDPSNAILEFADILVDYQENSRALAILEEYLEAIERSWENQNQCLAYHMIARLYNGKNDFAKSNIYFERQLSIAKETQNVETESYALNGLGFNYGRMGDYGKAMAYLEQALVIESERGDDRKGMTHCAIGDVLVEQEGREKEAILMFQKCVGLCEEGNSSDELVQVFLKLGQAYTNIEAWDDAIASLEKATESSEYESLDNLSKSRVKQSLGNTYLAKHESLPERNDEVIRKALFWSEAAFDLQNSEWQNEGRVHFDLSLDLAQEHYFLGDTERAHFRLKRYLDGTVKMGPTHCLSCDQACAKDAHMEKCSVCKVARYCSQDHSVQAWKKGRLCHRVMCPFLKRWRKITEGKGAAAELCDELFNDFFERVLASSKPK